MNREQIHELTRQNRLLLAGVLTSLDEEQWRAETLCAGWSAQEMAAHLVQPMLVGFPRVFLTAFRYRGDTARTIDHITRALARRPRAELIRLLCEHAADRLDPPRVGPMGPYIDTCVHLRDLARPLGLDVDVPPGQWVLVLNYLTDPGPAPALFGVRSLSGLSLRATDIDWDRKLFDDSGNAEVTGTAEALAMAITGRRAALADLSGPGVPVLAGRAVRA